MTNRNTPVFLTDEELIIIELMRGAAAPKETVSKDRIVSSLLNLRSECIVKEYREIVLKINSCLYSDYPHKKD